MKWHGLKRKSLRLEDEQRQPVDLQPGRQILSSLCETESWYSAIRKEFVSTDPSPHHPHIPTTPSISPVTSDHSPDLQPTFIKSKAKTFQTNHFTDDLGICFSCPKSLKSLFFLTSWSAGVIPFTTKITWIPRGEAWEEAMTRWFDWCFITKAGFGPKPNPVFRRFATLISRLCFLIYL